MKTTFKIMAIIILMVSVACKNESPKHSTEHNTIKNNVDPTKTTNYKENGNFEENTIENNTVDDSLSTNWNIDDPKRQQSLYTIFSMTKEQITRYENALGQWKVESLDNPYEKMSASERISKEDKILKDILNASQYEKYRKWTNRNDERGI